MIDEKELKKILREAIKASGNNISQWARDNGLFTQRGNISEIAYGDRRMSETVAKKLGYKKAVKVWVLKDDKKN